MGDVTKRAVKDIIDGICAYKTWSMMAWEDLIARYRRTLLGPFWYVLSHGIFISGLAFLFSKINHQDLGELFVYIAAGMTAWSFILMSLNEGSSSLLRASGIIHAFGMSVYLQFIRATVGNFLIFLHNLLPYILVIMLIKNPLNSNLILVIPGLFIVILACLGLTSVLGVVGARYRDLAPGISSITSVLFMLTPIFWKRSSIEGDAPFIDYNPVNALISLIRAPMIGEVASSTDWLVGTSFAAFMFLLGLVLFIKNRSQLSYWIS